MLGRAGALVLRNDPRAFHVRLDGPRERRIEQAMRLERRRPRRGRAARSTRPTARARPTCATSTAPTRAIPRYYHLTIDSTALPLDAVVDLIVLAAESRTR